MATLSFGLVGDRVVFMDEQTDSYFVLDPSHEESLRHLLKRGEPLRRNSDLLEIFGLAAGSDIVEAEHPAPSVSVLEQSLTSPPSLATVVKVAKLVRSTRWELRNLPLQPVLRSIVATAGEAIGSYPGPEIAAAAVGYLSARRLVPLAGNCLVDSISLVRWLGARKPLALLFGVKLDPFAAHCWVQAGDLLLNDHVDTVAAFTPVRVIRCTEAMQ